MKWLIKGFLALLLVFALLVGALFFLKTSPRDVPSQLPGHISFEIDVPHRDVPLPLNIWYPADPQGAPTLLGQNALFYGHYVSEAATPPPEELPLVILIHGSGGNAERMGWLASSLANRGYLVVGADHPGVRSMDSHQEDTLRIWERPQDVSAILDHLQTSPPKGINVNAGNAAIVGFSIGGQSALMLAGMRYDAAKFAAYCSENNEWDCAWFAEGGIDFDTIDSGKYSQTRRDTRVKTVVAIDPAAAPASLGGAEIQTGTMILNMGNAGEIFAGVRADEIAAQAGAAYHAISGSWHFSFLAECSRLGDILMRVMGEELICSDSGLRNRAVIHAEAQSLIGDFLDKEMK